MISGAAATLQYPLACGTALFLHLRLGPLSFIFLGSLALFKKKKNKQKVIINWIKMHESDGFGKYCRALFINLISQHLAVRTCSASLNDLDLSQYGLSYEKKIKIRGGRSERAHYWLFQIKDLDLLVFIA